MKKLYTILVTHNDGSVTTYMDKITSFQVAYEMRNYFNSRVATFGESASIHEYAV